MIRNLKSHLFAQSLDVIKDSIQRDTSKIILRSIYKLDDSNVITLAVLSHTLGSNVFKSIWINMRGRKITLVPSKTVRKPSSRKEISRLILGCILVSGPTSVKVKAVTRVLRRRVTLMTTFRKLTLITDFPPKMTVNLKRSHNSLLPVIQVSEKVWRVETFKNELITWESTFQLPISTKLINLKRTNQKWLDLGHSKFTLGINSLSSFRRSTSHNKLTVANLNLVVINSYLTLMKRRCSPKEILSSHSQPQ